MNQIYQEIRQFAIEMFRWTKPKLQVIILMLYGILIKRTICLTELARTFDGNIKVKHRQKRLWRFLQSTKIDDSEIYQATTSKILQYFANKPKITIAIDWTYIKDKWAIIVAGISYRGRMLPLLLKAYSYGNLPYPQPTLERRFISELLARLDSIGRNRSSVVLVADRGFGSTEFIRWLHQQHVLFVIRLQGEFVIRSQCFHGQLKYFPIQCGQTTMLPNILLRKEHPVTINLCVSWHPHYEECWRLATNLDDPHTIKLFYRRRMHVEEGFRDGKHRFSLELLWRWSNLGNLNRILAVLACAIAFLFVLFISHQLFWNFNLLQTAWGKLSFISLAISFIDNILLSINSRLNFV